MVAILCLLPGIPGCRGRFDLKNGGGQMKNGAVTGSISHIDTRLRLSPAVDSSQPTYSKICWGFWVILHDQQDE